MTIRDPSDSASPWMFVPFALFAVAWLAFLVVAIGDDGNLAWAGIILGLLGIGLALGFSVNWNSPHALTSLAAGDAVMLFTTPFLIAGGIVFAVASGLQLLGILAASAGLGYMAKRAFTG